MALQLRWIPGWPKAQAINFLLVMTNQVADTGCSKALGNQQPGSRKFLEVHRPLAATQQHRLTVCPNQQTSSNYFGERTGNEFRTQRCF